MNFDDKEKINRIEELKRKLYNPNFKSKVVYHDSFVHKTNLDVKDSWEDEYSKQEKNKFFMKNSGLKKFFIFSVFLFLFALAYLFYTFFWNNATVSNQNIDISIFGNTFISGGEPLSLQIEVVNRNTSSLQLVDLVLEYPKGSAGDDNYEIERLRKSIGVINAGESKVENMNVVLYGEQGSIRQIKVSLEYRVEGSNNAIFEKNKFYEVTINSTPINLNVNAPFDVSPNQDFLIDLNSVLNTNSAIENLMVKINYPLGFEFISSVPKPSFGNNVWDFNKVVPGKENKILITGKMIDVFDGEEKVFQIFSGSQSQNDKTEIGVVFNSTRHSLLIKRPFVEALVYVGGEYKKEYTMTPKSSTNISIRWANNFNTKLSDLEIRAKISGNALNRRSIQSKNGFYNSIDDTILWDKNSFPNFREVFPGESGEVSFSLASSELYSSLQGLLQEPSINIEVSVSGRQSLEGNVLQKVDNTEFKKIKLITELGFVNRLFYYSGPFKNTGTIPPQIEKETTYTVVWTLSNTANNVSQAKIVSRIPNWVTFMGEISPKDSDLKYDPFTREITWDIGNIRRGTSLTELTKEIAFQISFLPSLSQVQTSPVLINTATLTAYDDFANVELKVQRNNLNTAQVSDSIFPSNGGRVVEGI